MTLTITKHNLGRILELQVQGRLDAYWADHFTDMVLAAVREGHHRIAANLSAVDYLSSAGLRAMVRCHKELAAIHGVFSVTQPSRFVNDILKMTGLKQLLIHPDLSPAADSGPDQPESAASQESRMEVIPCGTHSQAVCRTIGRAATFTDPPTDEERCEFLTFTPEIFGLGIGAPGPDEADCRSRLGEFLAVAGAVTFLPTDGGNVPDYLVAAEQFTPQLQVSRAICWPASFSHLIRFESGLESPRSLDDIARNALTISRSEIAGIVLVAETHGLVGAALQRSPAMRTPQNQPLRHPEIRNWLMFTGEPAFAGDIALVVGIALTGRPPGLTPWVRPLNGDPNLQGHFHAATFDYHPLKKGKIDCPQTIRSLFEAGGPHGLLHLINDDRPHTGAGQSLFTQGACWVCPLRRTDKEGQ